MFRRKKLLIILLVLFLFCVTIYTLTKWNGRLITSHAKTVPDDKRKARLLRNFDRDMKSYFYLDLMKETKSRRSIIKFTMVPWKIKSWKKEKQKDVKWSMIVLVKSHFNNTSRRNFARTTWASNNYINGLRFKTVFIVGTGNNDMLRKENEKYGDLLQIKFNDTYENLVYKTLAGMQWASEEIPQHWFYSSMDDDVLPDFKKIIDDMKKMIQAESSHRNNKIQFGKLQADNTDPFSTDTELADFELPIYCGFGYRVKTRPKRKGESKWYISEEKYPLKRYPPYCFGGFYTMTIKLTADLYKLSRKMNLFWIDDIWITGFVRLKYFSDRNSKCIYCKVNNTTMGLWTESSNNFASAITGDENFLRNEWNNILSQFS